MDTTPLLHRFGLRADPFPRAPGDACFLGATRGPTWTALLHVLRTEPGLVAVVGEPGAGKTVLCRRLGRALRDRFVVLRIDADALRRGSPEAVVHAALARRRPGMPADVGGTALRTRLGALHDAGRPVLMLVDDAHRVPAATLDRLRLLSQRGLEGDVARIVLLGTAALSDLLATPGAQALATRVTQVLTLRRLAADELPAYLAFRLRAAGRERAPADAFEPAAARLVASMSRGVPGRIDAIAARAMRTAHRRGRDVVRTADVVVASVGVALAG